jgi:hypothetical protein
MMLKRKSTQSQRRPWRLLRAGAAGLVAILGAAALTAGCLDRPVAPAVPKTSNVYVDEIRQTAVDKIDLLFMIDNSTSMADKQVMLSKAVPQLVDRLITPLCVRTCTDKDNCTDAQKKDGISLGVNADAMGRCATGSAEFNPIKDIHVGIVTSSLGSHGATGTTDVCVEASGNDHAHLLGTIRPELPLTDTYNSVGFLKWDETNNKYNPKGDSNAMTFEDKFTKEVTAAGEHGCGFEASLESWYRFLIDPAPPLNVVVDPNTKQAAVQGVDDVVINQRAAFLRPDSLVAIVMLTDENDCSIQDQGYGYLVSRSLAPLFRATSQCLNNPNDPCCQSCGEGQARDGCPALTADSECSGKTNFLTADEDTIYLRCWQQKRRFGFDLLYPTQRYVDGLTNAEVYDWTNTLVPNPLYAPGEKTVARDPGLVFLAGIVGVPWQDIADADSLTGPGLRYLTASQLTDESRWATILGDPTASPPVTPADPLMVETPDDRTTIAGLPQANPITNDALVKSDSTNPKANKINGHEQVNQDNSDLQYACIFPLPEGTIDCAKNSMLPMEQQGGCDCAPEDVQYNRPLCQPPAGGMATTTQSFAKAYPGLRHLKVLHDFGDNSIVASICPKIATDEKNPDYGYSPAVKAIIDRLKDALRGKCLPRPLVPKTTDSEGLTVGQVPCKVVEASLPDNGACNCDTNNGRLPLADGSQLRTAVLNKLRNQKSCADPVCDTYCTCEIAQFAGADLETCQNNKNPAKAGYCYINATPGEDNVGNAALVADCPADSKRLLNFGQNTPATGAIALVACLGASLGSTDQ